MQHLRTHFYHCAGHSEPSFAAKLPTCARNMTCLMVLVVGVYVSTMPACSLSPSMSLTASVFADKMPELLQYGKQPSTYAKNATDAHPTQSQRYATTTYYKPDYFYPEVWATGSTCGSYWACRYLYTMVGTTKVILTSDIVFYWAHRAMHHFPMAKAWHRTHHDSYASDAIGGYVEHNMHMALPN